MANLATVKPAQDGAQTESGEARSPDPKVDPAPADKPAAPKAVPPKPDPAQVLEQVTKVTPAKRSWGTVLWLFVAVIIPFGLLWGYLAFIATPQYSSGFRFVIHPGNSISATATGGGSGDSMSSGGGVGGISVSTAELIVANFMISDYITSGQMVTDLQKQVDLRKIFSDPSIDWYSRLSPDASPEQLAAYWESHVTTDFDMLTGLNTVTVHAFTPETSLMLANAVMQLSENLVNTIGARPLQDSVEFLSGQADEASKKMLQARDRIREFRVRHLSIDPTADATMTDTLVGKLTDRYVNVTTQLAVLRSQLNADAPSIQQLEDQAKALADEIAKARRQVAESSATVNGDGAVSSYAAQLQDYEDLQLDLQIATANYEAAHAALLAARNYASQKQFYVLTYVRPSQALTPDLPNIPKTLAIAAFVLMAFWIVSTLVTHSLREHL